MSPVVSVVVPIYNEAESLRELFSRVRNAGESWGVDFEVVAVDDGSVDATGEMLDGFHRRDGRWKVLHLSRNFGHQAAISIGLEHARGDVVAIIDGDLQDPPEAIAGLIEKWRDGYDVVYAVRKKRKENVVKRCCYYLFYRTLKRLASIDIPLDSGDFCVMDRRVVDAINSLPERTRFLRGLRCWTGFSQIGVESERHERFAGKPKYTLSKLIKLALDGVFSFSTVPLKIANLFGIFLCSVSLLLGVLIVVWRIADVRILSMNPRDATGWASILATILLLSGLQFFMIGILGEYIARIFAEVKQRPTAIVAAKSGFDAATEHSNRPAHSELADQAEQTVLELSHDYTGDRE